MRKRNKDGARNTPIGARNTPIVDSAVLWKYKQSGGRAYCDITVDGKVHRKLIRKVADTSQAKADAVVLAESVVLSGITRRQDEQGKTDIQSNLQNWDAMEEPRRQRIGQNAIRDLVAHARRARELRDTPGPNNPEALMEAMCCRPIIDNVWDVQTGTHVERATYFALEGPGEGTEYGDVNAFVIDLKANANPSFSVLLDWLASFPLPQEISTEGSF